ncbi:MAG: hypothetical protein PHS93_08105 [Candidatus Omnitrophica bacterium]|nr:hypothetical protein [Candidatus Omnitrophota bacterium]MDD5353105.1 hypothetical protein [Candidatus Omnitrophota bacterium]MDD5551482.1 hypothetical protein [Candidatus Omnitrophota bacterium]
MKESNFAKTYLPKWQAENPGSRLFRNNTGMAWQALNNPGSKNQMTIKTIWKGLRALILILPKPIFYGIGIMKKSNKKGRKRPVGGGDYIGWTEKTLCDLICNNSKIGGCPIEIGCDNCNFNKYKVAIFTNLEFKTSGVPESTDQVKFRKLVEKSGGITKVIRE